jgi:hypothetical protein
MWWETGVVSMRKNILTLASFQRLDWSNINVFSMYMVHNNGCLFSIDWYRSRLRRAVTSFANCELAVQVVTDRKICKDVKESRVKAAMMSFCKQLVLPLFVAGTTQQVRVGASSCRADFFVCRTLLGN